MKERPILFNTDMVKAILDGRKTQTRRPIKNQPKNGWEFEDAEKGGSLFRITSSHPKKGKWGMLKRRGVGTNFPEMDIEVSPFGTLGDHLWVRETFAMGLCTESTIAYRATHNPSDLEEGWFEAIKWRPSIHMPRWACRLVLEITDVRLERVQDITEKDSKAEGAKSKSDFQDLWQGVYPNSWKNNEWVWVIEFKIAELNGKKQEPAA